MVFFEKIAKQTSENLVYWVKGDTSHTPILLIPGFTGTHGDLLLLTRQLAEKHFVVIPEFPGWGDSPKGDSSFTITSYAHIIERVIQEVSLEKVSLIAHCMGAVVALETAYLFPEKVRSLILISTPYQEGTFGQSFFRIMTRLSEKVPIPLRPLFFFWRSRIITIPMSFFVLQTRTFGRKLHIISKTLHQQTHQDEHVLETNWNSLINFNYEKLKKLQVPAFLLHGEKDLLVPSHQAGKLSKILPHATVSLIPNAGHLPPVETPETLATMIEKYLR